MGVASAHLQTGTAAIASWVSARGLPWTCTRLGVSCLPGGCRQAVAPAVRAGRWSEVGTGCGDGWRSVAARFARHLLVERSLLGTQEPAEAHPAPYVLRTPPSSTSHMTGHCCMPCFKHHNALRAGDRAVLQVLQKLAVPPVLRTHVQSKVPCCDECVQRCTHQHILHCTSLRQSGAPRAVHE